VIRVLESSFEMWTIGHLSIQNSALVGALIVDFIIQWVRGPCFALFAAMLPVNCQCLGLDSIRYVAGGMGHISSSADRQAV